MVLASNVDELNFLASRLETLSAGERAELNAALQAPQSELSSIGRIRVQLDAAKKEQSKQPPPREKTKELEV